MRVAEQDISHIIGEIYEAGTNRDDWRSVLEQLRLVFQGSRACLTRFAAGSTDTIQSTHDPSFLCTEALQAFQRDTFTTAALMMPAGVAYCENEIKESALFRQGSFWNEWYAPRDMFNGLSANIVFDGSLWFLDIQRGQHQRVFDRDEARKLDALLPHIIRAGKSSLKVRDEGVLATLSSLTDGVVIVDEQRNLRFSNERAKQLLAMDQYPLSGNAGLLSCADREESSSLYECISSVCSMADDDAGVQRGLFLSSRDTASGTTTGLAGIHVAIRPFRDQHLYGMKTDTLALLIIKEMAYTVPDDFAAYVRKVFHLTPTEIKLALHLASGLSLQAAASELGISINTARHHLHQVFGKTSTTQQSQLVALLRPF